ncbi:hypothetical protein H4R18_002842 [Coemansia javaensis]|uniref:Histone deacetylase complex subunit SAP30 Sin3 binding domain-containing protein n=1 Tax=Coemansia javaensis TaxID=2761396 RepID=A0A9W8H9Q7_9FUNG|nr:hypothetical protein H4R18_002842 [Coemansia javaensis]
MPLHLDFSTLNIQVLRKYRQAFKLTVKARSSKDELVMAASHHYAEQMVDEVDTIARFLYTVHSSKGRQSAGRGAGEPHCWDLPY